MSYTIEQVKKNLATNQKWVEGAILSISTNGSIAVNSLPSRQNLDSFSCEIS